MGMASIVELEHQLAQLEQAHQAGQLSDEDYQRERAQLSHLYAEAQRPQAPAGSDFFSTGGGAPPTAQGVVMHGGGGGGKLQIGMVIRGRYQIEAPIGEGGMGVVYKVHDQLRDRTLAMKLLHPNFPPEAQSQLASELSMQERIRHKGVVQTYELDVDPETGRYFYTMEFVDGISLEQKLEDAKAVGRVPPLSIDECTILLESLADVLHTAHQENIVHRDLKPQNILLDDAGNAKLLDFGIAKDLSDQAQHTGFTGTPIYMAPEQLRGGGTVTPAADIYSVGVMLYQFLTGQLFYGRMPGPSEWLVEQGITPGFDASMDEVVFQALDFSPERRFQSMPELLNAYKQALEGSPQTARTSKSWSEAAEEAEPVAAQPVAAPMRSQSRIKGRAPVAMRSLSAPVGASINESISAKDKKKDKKKKKGRWLRMILFVFVGIPTILGVIGVVVSMSKENDRPKDTDDGPVVLKQPMLRRTQPTGNSANNPRPTPPVDRRDVDKGVPVPPPLIDLAQVNTAFRTTKIPSAYGKIRLAFKRYKAWMWTFEQKVNEIYGGKELIFLQLKRSGKIHTILGFIDANNRYGFQPEQDTLVFKIVQKNSVYKSLLRRFRRRRGSWMDQGNDDGDGNAKGAGGDAMGYSVEDGMGWTYLNASLPPSAPYYQFAQRAFVYYTTLASSRRKILTMYRRSYRKLSLYQKRQEKYGEFVKAVSQKRTAFYRAGKGRLNK